MDFFKAQTQISRVSLHIIGKVLNQLKELFVIYVSVSIYISIYLSIITSLYLSLFSIYLCLVPPEKPRIYNERDEEQNISLGPYRIGERVVIKCETWGGIIINSSYLLKLHKPFFLKVIFRIHNNTL